MKMAKNANGSFLYDTGDMGPDIDGLTGDIASVLTERIAVYTASVCGDSGGRGGESMEVPSVPSSTVRVESVEVPGTNGTYADMYIEIDHSQQQMYVWEGGKVTREYGVSGFFDRYHFFGVFSIINKSDNAWSSIAKKWMPFWMAYYYDPAQSAWLGIHELVYWTDENGVFHEEGSDSIGPKKSGGCIRLDRGKAEELYNWAEVGIPVLIHP